MKTGMDARSTILAFVMVAALGAVAFFVGGCEGFRDGVAKMVGAPTSSQVQTEIDAADKAEESIAEANAAVAESEKASAELADRLAAIDAEREGLRKAQAEAAARLASATEAERPVLVASIKAYDETISVLEGKQTAAQAALKASEESRARAAATLAKAQADLAERIDFLATVDQRTADAIQNAGATVKQVGATVGNLVPGAGALADTIGSSLATILGLGLGGGAATIAARRKVAQVQRKADAASRAIAVTEAFGIDNIAKDPSIRAAAKKVMASDPEAMQEYAIAKAKAKTVLA